MNRTAISREEALSMARAHAAAGRYDDATALYAAMLDFRPDDPDALFGVAAIAFETGRHEECEQLLAGVLAAISTAPLWYLRGRLRRARGDAETAAESYRRAIELDPGFGEAYVSLGAALRALGRSEEAVACYREGIQTAGERPDTLLNLGNALAERQRPEEAIAAYRRAAELDPRLVEARLGLARQLQFKGERAAAIEAAQAAVELAPRLPAALELLAGLLGAAADYGRALECLRRLVALAPRSADYRARLASTLMMIDSLEEAEAQCREAMALAPDHAEALYNLGAVLVKSLRVEDGVDTLARAALVAPQDPRILGAHAFALNYDARWSQEDIAARHREAGALRRPALAPRANRLASGGARRIRIGYLSPDFRRHSVAFFLEPLLAHHDRDRFAITCYHTDDRIDDVTHRLRALADGWHDCARDGPVEISRKVSDDGIDVLVDLAGYTENTRIDATVFRPAGVHLSYLGYPTATGHPGIDFRVSDAMIDPPGEPDLAELTLRMDRTMFSFRTEAVALPSAPALDRNGQVTFGSFGNLAKVCAETIRLWSGVLRAVPGSRLCLKARGLGDAAVRTRVGAAFAAQGIDPERLLLSPWRAALAEHLGAYAEVDIALDTYPYAGVTTTCEALWMGVPVVSLAGATHASRSAMSILPAAGLADLVTCDPDQFVPLAAALAADAPRIRALRTGLRETLAAGPLMDHAGHAREFERLLLESLERVAGRPVRS